MIISPWIFFLWPVQTPSVLLLPLLVGGAVAALVYQDWRDTWVILLALPLGLFFPVMFLSDFLAHILFNGCVLY